MNGIENNCESNEREERVIDEGEKLYERKLQQKLLTKEQEYERRDRKIIQRDER